MMAINGINMVTNRSQADVNFVKTLIKKGFDGMTEYEKTDFLAGLPGAYNYTDFNRVESAIEYIAQEFAASPSRLKALADALGVDWQESAFALSYDPNTFDGAVIKKNWTIGDVLSGSDRQRYIDNILKAVRSFDIDRRNVPTSLRGLDHIGANAIEKGLEDANNALIAENARVSTLIKNTAKSWYFSGELYGGEV